MYKVIVKFADLKDYNHIYEVGDTYPRDGKLPIPSRVEELSTNKNRLQIPLIEEIPEEIPVSEDIPTETVSKKRKKKKAE